MIIRDPFVQNQRVNLVLFKDIFMSYALPHTHTYILTLTHEEKLNQTLAFFQSFFSS